MPEELDPTQPQALDVNALVAQCIAEMETGGAAVVDRICADHPSLEAKIRAHLQQLGEMGLLRPAGSAGDAVPAKIGRYAILDEIGRGGMGTVYLASEREPVQRRVAIKIVRAGMDTVTVLRRFAAEQKALAQMQHPGIAQIFDSGTTDGGRPYFVMEYVPGSPITHYCDSRQLDTAERLGLFAKVCDAVQHAHQKGILHRDLKPSNILVMDQDAEPVAKVIDFGIAKATRATVPGETLVTVPGQVLGTPEYMSPEQAGSGGLDIDTRTDVYSLGAVLYELLCGTLPFDAKALCGVSLDAMHRALMEKDPPTPSTRIGDDDIAARRRTDSAKLRRLLRRDLDWIVLRALERDRERRYGSVQDLADDIRRFLARQPVHAGPPTRRYRLGKFVRRHRITCTVAGLGTLCLVGAFVASLRFAVVAEAKARDFDLLSGVLRIEQLDSSVKNLFPTKPDKVDAMRRWLAKADSVLALRPRIAATIAGFADRGDDLTRAEEFLVESLTDLSKRLETFAVSEKEPVAIRLWWAERIKGWTLNHAGARVTWQDAAKAIAKAGGVAASVLYKRRKKPLQPQIGLVPIGMNPRTKLWEFYHLRSAWDVNGGADPGALEIPKHEEDGSIRVHDGLGIVFVLLPGGETTVGTQMTDPNGANYDSLSRHDEKLVQFTMPALFVARHELTQAQWLRLANLQPDENPSNYKAGKQTDDGVSTLCHPVESVQLRACLELFSRHGIDVPTETAWEYACRAGTVTPWNTGAAVNSLDGAANTFDKSAEERVPKWRGMGETFDTFKDGYSVHAPVGSFAPNPFGLYDMHGNVFEWCGPGDTRMAMCRGGSWFYNGVSARSSFRLSMGAAVGRAYIGVRAVRLVDGEESIAR